jgi:hypothetical protein
LFAMPSETDQPQLIEWMSSRNRLTVEVGDNDCSRKVDCLAIKVVSTNVFSRNTFDLKQRLRFG